MGHLLAADVAFITAPIFTRETKQMRLRKTFLLFLLSIGLKVIITRVAIMLLLCTYQTNLHMDCHWRLLPNFAKKPLEKEISSLRIFFRKKGMKYVP